MSLQVPWQYAKKSVKDIQKRIRTRPTAKCLFPKQFQNRNWQVEVRMMCNREHCLHRLMKEVRMVCNGEHCLHWLKLFYLWKYVHLYFENIFPFQNPAYEVCLMERWSSKPGKRINQMECLLWNSIRSSFWYFISYVGVLPEWRAGMGQTSTSNVTRHY